RHEARRKKEQEHTPAERLRSARRQLVSYAGTSLFLLGINYMTGTGFWWAIFPILGMGMGLSGSLGRLWADGIPLRSVFTGSLPAGATSPALAAGSNAGPEREGLEQARAEYARIQDSIGRLSETERKMLPDVKATADALFARVQALAPAL